ncbi:hypothetical protein D9V37_08125 [Nocardioides mangrovicus]|uniref:Intradiol ring-cleavage dioxygenases domain-containing protein n=1 Tax=Nocardioides mangrovicus TaxID=2478913 RepID=A0A3L8P452_9ACTN|nr:intradiol ring-cleavage dioxygenase [Nocardioides mangrovicus]RLV49844.1 hypothetical protein D9V37_08125 [Nocardioides mangrovicus]
MTPPHSRRTVLRAGAASGIGAVLATEILGAVRDTAFAVPTASSRAALATSTACTTLTKEETQGPFWVDEKLERSDIRTDTEGTTGTQAGVPLTLTINLQDAGASCAPQAGAYVDIWHANNQGAYSDVSGSGNPDNVGQNWLRGYQVSDANGSVTFTTVMPGWYTSRTIHIHFRVRLTLSDSSTVNFTSQLYFDDTINSAVLATSGYKSEANRDTYNSGDQLYDATLQVPLTGDTTSGYAGSFTANLDFGDDSSTSTSSSSTDQTVSATLVSAVAKRRSRRRLVVVRLNAGERVTGRVRLVRHDTVLAHRRWGWLAQGAHTLRVKVPRKVAHGDAKVLVNLADASGNTWYAVRRVHVPR